jgi:hypothetical protein
MNDASMANLVGKSFHTVTGAVGDDVMDLLGAEGSFRFYHNQDCCESVSIAEVQNGYYGEGVDLVLLPALTESPR